MQTILLLGGSAQQVIAIETAKRLGYRTVLCDFLENNCGKNVVDKFYLVSTTDMDAVLEVAKKENIDGVLAYASDPAAPTAAYVAEKLGLPTNPYHSVSLLCNKDRFRQFLRENGFHAPKSCGYHDKNAAISCVRDFQFPVIVKPVDSSGSKGVTVLRSAVDAKAAIDLAFSYSRAKRIIIEEFIEKKHPYLIGGDIFVADGKVVLWGLMNCHRDSKVNPLVPVGKSYPLLLADEDINRVKGTLQSIVRKLGFQNGAMNVELVIDRGNRVWPIDIGPRSGGNMIPDLLSYIFDVDVVEMSVLAAMGEPFNTGIKEGTPFYATHNLHIDQNGIYKEIIFDERIEPYIIKKCIYKKTGDAVEFFDNASKALGIIFMKFQSQEEMQSILEHIGDYIRVIVE